jgi:hypothetical protein
MKIINRRHHNQVLDSILNKALHQKGGSIMIWTVMLGLLLTSVFFFFSMRQRMMVAVQRDTAAQQSAKMLIDSYADYLQHYPTEIKVFAGGKYYGRTTIDDIYTKLTKIVDSVENSVDGNQTQAYNFPDPGSIYVEWNKCAKIGVQDFSGDLLVNGALYPHQTAAGCAANDEYDDVVGPLSVSDDFTIETLNAPFFFRIKGAAGTTVYDNQWHMEIAKDLGYGKVITVRRTFPVVP